MLLQSRAHRAHSLGKATARLTLRAETASPPQHGRTQRPLRGVVGRLDLLVVDKRPQRGKACGQIRTQRAKRVALLSPALDLFPDRLLQRLEHQPHRIAVNFPSFEASPYRHHQLCHRQQVCRSRLPRPSRIHPALERTQQMCPAELASLGLHAVIGAQPVRGEQTGEGLTHKCHQPLLAAATVDAEQRGRSRDCRPQPGHARPLTPGCLVNVGVVARCNCLLYLAVGWLERLTRHLLERNHASEADGQFEEVDKQGDQFAVADAVAIVQERHVSGHARAQGARRDVVGARCGHPALTARAAHTEVLVCGDLGHDDGKVPDLLTPRRSKGRQQFGEGQLTGGAAGGVQLDDAGHVLSGNELALLVGMPRLRALGLGLAARSLDRARRCGRGVRGGRLRGVLQVLVGMRFEGGNLRQQFILAGLRCQEDRLNSGLCCQQRTNKRLHPPRGWLPILLASGLLAASRP